MDGLDLKASAKAFIWISIVLIVMMFLDYCFRLSDVIRSSLGLVTLLGEVDSKCVVLSIISLLVSTLMGIIGWKTGWTMVVGNKIDEVLNTDMKVVVGCAIAIVWVSFISYCFVMVVFPMSVWG